MTFLKGCWLDNIYMPSSLKEGRRKGKQVVYPARRKLSCLANCSGEDQVGSKLPTLYDEDFLSLSLERGRRNGQLVVVCPCQAMAPFCLSVEGGAKPYRRLSWSLWRHGRGLAGAGDISRIECSVVLLPISYYFMLSDWVSVRNGIRCQRLMSLLKFYLMLSVFRTILVDRREYCIERHFVHILRTVYLQSVLNSLLSWTSSSFVFQLHFSSGMVLSFLSSSRLHWDSNSQPFDHESGALTYKLSRLT